MATNFSPSSGSYVLNKFRSISQWSDTGPSWPSCLELLAIFLALKSLYKNSSHVHINFQCDNTSAIAYINDMGGTSPISMDILAKSVWLWCIDRDIHISATYVASIDNSADFFS